MKILMLILASNGGEKEIYTRLQYEIWRNYMHLYPDVIDAYFYKCNPLITEEYIIDGDTVYVKCDNSYPITLKRLQLVLKAFNLDEYDFILRPNLSSFFILDKYIEYMYTIPTVNTCTSYMWAPNSKSVYAYPSGAGFTISRDIAKYIVTNTIIPNNEGIDDVSIGTILNHLKSNILPHPMIFITCKEHRSWLDILYNNKSYQDFPSNKVFHVRIFHEDVNRTDRAEDDIKIHYELLDYVTRSKSQHPC